MRVVLDGVIDLIETLTYIHILYQVAVLKSRQTGVSQSVSATICNCIIY